MNILIFKLIHLPERDLQVNSTSWTSWSSGYFAQINIPNFSLIHPVEQYLQVDLPCWTCLSSDLFTLLNVGIFGSLQTAPDLQINPSSWTGWFSGKSIALHILIWRSTLLNIKDLGVTQHIWTPCSYGNFIALNILLILLHNTTNFWVTSYSLLTIPHRQLFTDRLKVLSSHLN